MDESTIKSLMTFTPQIVNGIKQIFLPYEDILRGKISIRINESSMIEKNIDNSPEKNISIEINDYISKLYTDKQKMTQDCIDYLKVIADCWSLKSVGFKQTILKKAAIYKPALNTIVFNSYGKIGDAYLEQLVTSNIQFIKNRWVEIGK